MMSDGTQEVLLCPTLDPNRCYGREDCEECKGLCSGHFLKLDDLWEHVSNGGKMLSEPPSEVLLKEFNRHRVIPDDGRLKEIAKWMKPKCGSSI